MNDSEFFFGYIEALFFTESHESHNIDDWDEEENVAYRREVGGGNIPHDSYIGDLDEDTLTDIREECEKFQEENKELLVFAHNHLDYDDRQAGRDFWFTRNRHGVGYWDRDELKGGVGAALTEAAQAYGEVDVFWQDNKIYVA